jgi:hypothetical protein
MMDERALDRMLTEMLQGSLGLIQGQEDSLWSRFEARRLQEAAAWLAFATNMAMLGARLRPAIRPPVHPADGPLFFVPGQGG